MSFFNSMFSDVSKIYKGAIDDKSGITSEMLDARLNAFQQLLWSLDFKWHKLEASWKDASSVEANLKRTPFARVQMMRRARPLSKRMMMIGRFCNMVETLKFVLEEAKTLRNHVQQMRQTMGDGKQLADLAKKIQSLQAQQQTTFESVNQLENVIKNISAGMGGETNADEKELNDLYDQIDTALAEGNTKKFEELQGKITKMLTGGSLLAYA